MTKSSKSEYLLLLTPLRWLVHSWRDLNLISHRKVLCYKPWKIHLQRRFSIVISNFEAHCVVMKSLQCCFNLNSSCFWMAENFDRMWQWIIDSLLMINDMKCTNKIIQINIPPQTVFDCNLHQLNLGWPVDQDLQTNWTIRSYHSSFCSLRENIHEKMKSNNTKKM